MYLCCLEANWTVVISDMLQVEGKEGLGVYDTRLNLHENSDDGK
jgi:hypothetical protein